MSKASGHVVTLLLERLKNGDRTAEEALMPIIYEHLHQLAQQQLRLERPGHTLQPTALVNELYLRLLRETSIDWQSRTHLFAIAAQTIRRILVDYARARDAQRRPSSRDRVSLDEIFVYSEFRSAELLAIDEALEELAKRDPQQARIVEMRFFVGLTVDEVASVLGLSERTVKREWSFARAWLSRFLNGSETSVAGPQAKEN
jgi:RNA polymerase sigma-70 factor, ECF subfamily